MMNCLFVRAPFAGWIADGVKLIEYRTRETLIRGRIGIIESGTQTVIGDVELKDCVWNDTQKMWLWMLSRPRRYAKPVPFEHKRGCVTWALLDINPEAQEIAPRLTGARFKRESAEYLRTLDSWLLEHTRLLAENGTRAVQAAGARACTIEVDSACRAADGAATDGKG